jgi:RNA polymerase sigma-70 factor (ECF subfamily)
MSRADALARIEAVIPALRRYAWALLRHDADADDLVHDCLVRALDSPPTKRPDADVRPWLFTVMHNLWASGRRKARVRGLPATLDEAETTGATVVHASQHAELEARDVLYALDRLADDQRTVLLLVGVEGLSYAEVAQVLGVPIGTVMSRLSRARERLREEVDAPGRALDAYAPRPALRRVK